MMNITTGEWFNVTEPGNTNYSTNYSFIYENVPEGQQTIYVRAVDTAGNIGPEEPINVTINSTFSHLDIDLVISDSVNYEVPFWVSAYLTNYNEEVLPWDSYAVNLSWDDGSGEWVECGLWDETESTMRYGDDIPGGGEQKFEWQMYCWDTVTPRFTATLIYDDGRTKNDSESTVVTYSTPPQLPVQKPRKIVLKAPIKIVI